MVSKNKNRRPSATTLSPDQIMKTICDAVSEYFEGMGILTSFGVFTFHPDKPEAGNIIIHGDQDQAIKAMQTKICELQIRGSFPAPINTEPV